MDARETEEVFHDLKNSLAAMAVTTDVLLRPHARKLSARRHLEAIHCIARRMLVLLNELAPSGHKAPLERRRVSLRALVEAALAETGAMALSRRITIDAHVKSDLELICDPGAILRVLDNLIGNALKFTPAGGSITVQASRRRNRAWLSVSDDGCGISRDDLPHVFERGWTARTTVGCGTGLGLAIAREIVEAHGGRIWAESRLGAGSSFQLALPLAR
jgi:signal transduction histidine kinase